MGINGFQSAVKSTAQQLAKVRGCERFECNEWNANMLSAIKAKRDSDLKLLCGPSCKSWSGLLAMKTNAKSLKATDDVAGKAAQMRINRMSLNCAYPFSPNI